MKERTKLIKYEIVTEDVLYTTDDIGKIIKYRLTQCEYGYYLISSSGVIYSNLFPFSPETVKLLCMEFGCKYIPGLNIPVCLDIQQLKAILDSVINYNLKGYFLYPNFKQMP